jgi:drug/metabolite transporter (DMT)-like permease
MSALVHFLGETLHWTVVAFLRIFLTFLLALMYARATGVRPMIFGSKILWARSIFGSIALTSNFYALTHLSITDAITILKTSPIWIAVILAVIHRRGHQGKVWFAMGLGVAGVFLMEQPKFDGEWFPIIVTICSAFFIASSQVSMSFLHNIPTLKIVMHFSGCASIVTLCIMLFGQGLEPIRQVDWTGARWLLLMALFGTVGQVFMTTAFRKGHALLMSLIGLLAIPLAAMYDYLLWDKTLGWIEWGGIALITVSIILCSGQLVDNQRKDQAIVSG